jgi:hypothetical protein
MGVKAEVRTVAFVCDKCGLGQAGDVDGERDKAGKLAAKHREWDGRTTVQLVGGAGACPNCGDPVELAGGRGK